jgi:AcrR family transcriptional regulator
LTGLLRSSPLTRGAGEPEDREDGVEGPSMRGPSMRGLGRALGRDPMALYRYAANKSALLDGVAEPVLDELTLDTQDDERAAQLRSVARDFRRLALAHPKVVGRARCRDTQALRDAVTACATPSCSPRWRRRAGGRSRGGGP